MGTRGRKSTASLTVVQGGVLELPKAPPPPELSPEQAVEWRAIVGSRPAEWFPRETYGLLAQYCRHVVAARRVADLIYQSEHGEGEFHVADYDRLLRMQEREGRALSSLACRMRIAQQATFSHNKRAKNQASSPPWEN